MIEIDEVSGVPVAQPSATNLRNYSVIPHRNAGVIGKIVNVVEILENQRGAPGLMTFATR